MRVILLLALSAASGAFVARRAPIFVVQRPLRAAVSCKVAIQPVEDEKAYKALIADATRENRCVVIKFYAGWCRACKAAAPKVQRVADEWGEQGVEFHEILFEKNKGLCKSLGITVLPFMEIVAGSAGKVESFTCGPSKIAKLTEKLEEHVRPVIDARASDPPRADAPVDRLINPWDGLQGTQ